MATPTIYTLLERPAGTVEQLRNGKYLIYVNITEQDHVIERGGNIEDGENADNQEPITQHEYLCEAVEVSVLDYPTIVAAIVRSRYSADEVEAILLNGSDTKEHAAELAALQAWRTVAKETAHTATDGAE